MISLQEYLSRDPKFRDPKPLGGSMINSPSHFLGTSGDVVVKIKLFPHSDSVAGS